MPIYRYQCSTCDQASEYIQPVNAAPPANCRHCHGVNLSKQVAPTAQHSGGQITTVAERDIPASAFKPLTPPREGKWTRDRHGHKVLVG